MLVGNMRTNANNGTRYFNPQFYAQLRPWAQLLPYKEEPRAMKVKPLQTLGIIVIVLALCAIGWLLFQPKTSDPVVTYKATGSKHRATEALRTTQSSQERREETPQEQAGRRKETLEERAERRREGHLDMMRALGWQDDDPHMQKLQSVLNSPAYLEYVRKQEAKPGYNVVLWWELHESLGIPHTGRRVQAEQFQKYFPDGGEYADYEPLMRQRVAEIALEDPTRTTTQVLSRFNDDFANLVWGQGYFNGNEGEYEWGDNIRQNAARIVAEPTPWDGDTPPAATDAESLGDIRTTDVAEEPADTLPPREAAPSLEKVERIPESEVEIEAALTEELLPAAPERPTDVTVENALRSQFSPQRFTRAIQMLNQYGPEEGLRRLKAADPEVAAQVERLLPRREEAD